MAEFDAGLIYKGLAGGGENIAGGITDLIKKRKHEEEQNAFNQTAFQTLATAKGPDGQSLLTEEEKQKFTSGNLNVRNGITNAGMSRLASVFQTAKEKQAMELQAAHMQLMGAQTQAARKSMEDNPYAQQPIWMQHPTTGEQYQAGIYDDKGTPHYLPYAGLGPNGAVPFQPGEDVSKKMSEAGYTFAPTSGRAGRWVNTTGNKPDLDEQGNPMFTPDGSAYVSGGKVRPLTQPMIDQRKEWQKKQQDAKDAAGPHWYDIFSSKSSPSAPQAASGAAPVNPQDQQALAWAQANPRDPRAAAILKKLGVQ